jgi:Restriction Enzyme Adenine Methylase Associated
MLVTRPRGRARPSAAKLAFAGHVVRQHLEGIDRTLIERYQQVLREHVRGRQGVYALYRGAQLRYVGLAVDLNVRLKAHLSDRHAETWDRFSLYITTEQTYLQELEALLLRILRPRDNRQTGALRRSEDLKPRLKRLFREHHRREFESVFGPVAASRRRVPRFDGMNQIARTVRARPALAGYVRGPLQLRAVYKGKRLSARAMPDGTIRFDGSVHHSPSGAAVAACRRSSCDGWTFWRFRRGDEWVPLSALREIS